MFKTADRFLISGGWLLVSNVVFDSSTPPIVSAESSFRAINNCHTKQMFLEKSAMFELRSHLSFAQLRFFCSKQHGRTFHVTTVANSTGEAVIKYFTGQAETAPASCGSFVPMKDDNSKLAQNCAKWGENSKGQPLSGTWSYYGMGELNDHSVFIKGSAHWVTISGKNRWECDDFKTPPSSGDFWRVFVR